jgi:nicotinamidase/pyrazinamidase
LIALRQHLLVIDPQHDFCHPKGALFVGGADKDMMRLAEMVKRIQGELTAIHVTLDCHHYIDIAHPVFWKSPSGRHPDPFTIISRGDVEKGTWSATDPSMKQHTLEYVARLEENGRYQLCIWPPHCLIGSIGGTVVNPLHEALLAWEYMKGRPVDYVTKGTNIKTEHYSALIAEVPEESDPSTQLNLHLIQILKDAERILIAGEALSHCIANTIRDIADYLGEANVRKFVLLEDCSSSVAGFEQYGTSFVRDMTARGMQVATSRDL